MRLGCSLRAFWCDFGVCFGIYSSTIVLHQAVEEELQDISCYGSGGVWVFCYGHLHHQDYEQDGNGIGSTGAV